MMVSYAKAMDVWYTVCMVCVFLSLLEFAFVNVLDTREKQLKSKHFSKPNGKRSYDIVSVFRVWCLVCTIPQICKIG